MTRPLITLSIFSPGSGIIFVFFQSTKLQKNDSTIVALRAVWMEDEYSQISHTQKR